MRRVIALLVAVSLHTELCGVVVSVWFLWIMQRRFEVAFITAYHQQSDDTKLGKYERPGDPHICMRERLSE